MNMGNKEMTWREDKVEQFKTRNLKGLEKEK